MPIVDAIAVLPKVNAGGDLAQLPLLEPFSPGNTLQDLKTVVISNIVRVPEPSTVCLGLVCLMAIACHRGAARR
jgi:hypothetical protein